MKIQITLSEGNATPGIRNTVGGAPVLMTGQEIPECAQCGERMVLFVQFDMPPNIDTRLKAGSHFLAFMCPIHNEINEYCSDGARPNEFWDKEAGSFCLILNPPGVGEWIGTEDKYLVPKEILFEETEENVQCYEDGIESGEDEFKVGGVPVRINNKIEAVCGCGSPMSYFCQVPDGYGFVKKDSAPEQPDSFSISEYCLFLGNNTCFLACEAQCNPFAVTAILDN